MIDFAHQQTDEILEELEKKLKKEYQKAYEDIKKKADDFFISFKNEDEKRKALMEAGEITKGNYYQWRRKKIMQGNRWNQLKEQIAKDLSKVNVIAMQMINSEMNNVFMINANWAEYKFENDMKIDSGLVLYDKNNVSYLLKEDPDIIPWKPEIDIPKDMRWNRQQITSHILQGILQGESIDNLSERLLQTVNNNEIAARRTARTAITSTENGARRHIYEQIEKMGISLQQEWVATLDSKTRHSHGMADGQRVGLTKPFIVGGYKMKYPGDMSVPAFLTYNCRCRTITVEPPEILKGTKPRMTYKQWIAKKEKEKK